MYQKRSSFAVTSLLIVALTSVETTSAADLPLRFSGALTSPAGETRASKYVPIFEPTPLITVEQSFSTTRSGPFEELKREPIETGDSFSTSPEIPTPIATPVSTPISVDESPKACPKDASVTFTSLSGIRAGNEVTTICAVGVSYLSDNLKAVLCCADRDSSFGFYQVVNPNGLTNDIGDGVDPGISFAPYGNTTDARVVAWSAQGKQVLRKWNAGIFNEWIAPQTIRYLSEVWTGSDKEAWVVGDDAQKRSVISRFDGDTETVEYGPVKTSIRSIWGVIDEEGAPQLMAASASTIFRRSPNGEWGTEVVPNSFKNLGFYTGWSGRKHVYIPTYPTGQHDETLYPVIAQFTDSKWLAETIDQDPALRGNYFRAAWGTDGDSPKVYFVGTRGVIVRLDTAKKRGEKGYLQVIPLPQLMNRGLPQWDAIWGASESDYYITGAARVDQEFRPYILQCNDTYEKSPCGIAFYGSNYVQ